MLYNVIKILTSHDDFGSKKLTVFLQVTKNYVFQESKHFYCRKKRKDRVKQEDGARGKRELITKKHRLIYQKQSQIVRVELKVKKIKRKKEKNIYKE